MTLIRLAIVFHIPLLRSILFDKDLQLSQFYPNVFIKSINKMATTVQTLASVSLLIHTVLFMSLNLYLYFRSQSLSREYKQETEVLDLLTKNCRTNEEPFKLVCISYEDYFYLVSITFLSKMQSICVFLLIGKGNWKVHWGISSKRSCQKETIVSPRNDDGGPP